MIETLDSDALLAALAWQVELGVDECIGDTPVDRFALTPAAPAPAPVPAPLPARPTAPIPLQEADPVAEAEAAAAAAPNLSALRAALDAYSHCDLKRGARSLVFSDGQPGARVMIVGEAPGRDEDQQGRPFVGRAGRLLDRMLAAIGLDRTASASDSVYITNVLPWRPPQNRDPTPQEIAMMKPFVLRHIDLVDPDVVVVMGNISCHALLGQRGITRLRGTWRQIGGRDMLPTLHPAYLLRTPSAKREAWADMLALRARMKEKA